MTPAEFETLSEEDQKALLERAEKVYRNPKMKVRGPVLIIILIVTALLVAFTM